MAAFNRFQVFSENLAEKVHNLGADDIKLMLSNTAPSVSGDAVKADIVEIAGGNGYTAGGTTITITGSSQAAGTYSLVGNDVIFTATGGSIATFRYVVMYNNTPASPLDPLIGYYDYGSPVNLNDTDDLAVEFGTSILQVV